MIADLIKNTGIQYITIPLTLNDGSIDGLNLPFCEKKEETSEGDLYTLVKPYFWKEEDIYIEPDKINSEAYSIYGQLNPENIRRDYITEIDKADIFKVRALEALEVCAGHWIPLPFFRIRRDPKAPFHHGPENWCRGNLQEYRDAEEKYSHMLTLAFDTTTESVESSASYDRPRDTDASDNGTERFKCVLEKHQAPKFFTNASLSDWMYNLYWLPRENINVKNRLRHLAVYHVFIHLLDEVNALPEIGLLSGENSIEVGLALDIGNSRTCGIIAEKTRPYDSSPFDFTSARKLQVRNLFHPHQVCEEPFEMQVAFAEEKFGNPAVDQIEDVFEWPSLLRVGPEAIELTSIFESQDSQATMSSPKRYLWDTRPVKVPWIKVDREGQMGYHDDVRVRRYALYGIAEHMTSDGKVIGEKDRGRLFGATESRYSRSSLMTMAIYEILLHAISQINDHGFRQDLGNSTYRRVLKDLVLTCPTAMTVQEQFHLRKSAKDAVELIHMTVGEKIEMGKITVHPKLPDIDPMSTEPNPWKWDEATCSQLAYLYGEVVHKFGSRHGLFFQIKGKHRALDGGEAAPSLNIASIDIGGGTTDLMICNYTYDRDSGVPYITPTPMFWEGFNIAGDDIVKRVVENILIPEIYRELKHLGGANISGVLNELFGPNIGGQGAMHKIYRRQFANQVAAPFAYEALSHAMRTSTEVETITLEDIFKRYPRPESGLLEFVDQTISQRTGIMDFSLCELELTLNPLQINHGIRDIMQEVLDQLCHLIAHFDCDLVLLSGRPSRLPVISDMLSATLTFSPDKIIRLGDYRFGHWYPFADPNGYVGDPKSTVCVGALVGYLNDNERLPGLRFNLERLDSIQTTAKYIGVMSAGNSRITAANVLVSPEVNDGAFNFYGEQLIIGMRQLDSEDWIASPLYVFDFKDDEKKEALGKQGHHYPFKVKVTRFAGKGEFLSEEELMITDLDGVPIDTEYFDFSLRTAMNQQAHWRDSGSFIVQIEG